MGLLDELRNRPAKSLGGTDKTFIDADTLVDKSGEKYRLQGINAAEVDKVVGGQLKEGTAGGQATTDVVHGLANQEGFTNVRPILDSNGQPQRDQFGRILTDLVNDKGQSFSTEMLNAGAFDINKYTTAQQIAGRDLAEAERNRAQLAGTYEQTEFDKAADLINEAERREGEKSLGFKRTALNELERMAWQQAGYGHALADNVKIRNYDRDLDNNALNPFSDAWEQGWINAGESLYGVADMLGETAGWEGVEAWGEQGIQRSQLANAEYANKIMSYKDVDSAWDVFEYIGTNAAMSLPYMAATAAGTAASPLTGGASLSIPVALYTGDVWNEMEGDNKNAAVAIGTGIMQATLDKIGLDFIIPKSGISKKVMGEIIDKTAASKGLSKQAATDLVMGASRKELGQLSGNLAKFAKQQVEAKKVGMDLLKRMGVGAAGEGITEVMQETLGYTGANLADIQDNGFDWNELSERAINAAIAGSTLGGAFTIPGKVTDTLAWNDVLGRNEGATTHTASDAQLWANEEKNQFGRIESTLEIVDNARKMGGDFATPLTDRVEQDKQNKKSKGTWERAGDALLRAPRAAVLGSVNNIFTGDILRQSRTARQMRDVFGGGLQKVFNGPTFENFKHHQVAVYKNMLTEPRKVFEALAGKAVNRRSQKNQLSADTYKVLQSAVDSKTKKFNPNLIPDGPKKQTYVKLGHELNKLADKMYADQKEFNKDLGYVDNYLFKYKALDKGAVYKNRAAFQQKLMSEYNYTAADAKKLTDEIIDNQDVNDIGEAFSVVRGGIKPASHQKRSLNMSENQAFQEFMEQDMFANVSQAVKSAARYTAHRRFIGENGGVVAQMLDQMENEGVPKEEVNRIAARMQDYLDAESGNYGRPQSDLGKAAIRIQKNFMMLTTLMGLPLATVSSLVELSLTSKGLRKDQIFGKQGSLQALGKEFAQTMWGAADQVATVAGAKELEQIKNPTGAREKLKDLGYYEWDVGAATVTGVSETNPWQQWFYEEFFKWTGLTGYTNFTRAARASIAGDFLTDKSKTIMDYKNGGEYTREVQEAEEALRNLGIDVDTFVDLNNKVQAGLQLTPEEDARMSDIVREGTFNFINDAVALPQAANRPLLYQDPRFALFTQFNGFIATFTANHIPKLWGEYVKRGTPAMKYSAFATMATMIMMGFVSQHLRDLIKYGWDEEDQEERMTGANPYLDKAEYIQRGIRASGLLGTGERVLDQFFPLYETSSSNAGEWLFNSITGESPAAGHAMKIGKSAGAFLSGDIESGVKYAAKSAPLLGPFSDLNDSIAENVNWLFRGE